MLNVMIELSNRTTEIMAENLVSALAQHGIAPTVYRVLNNGTVEMISEHANTSKLDVLSQFYCDSCRPPSRGLVGTRLYRAMVANGWKDHYAAFVIFNDGGGHKRVIAEWGRRNNVPVFYVPESAGAIKGLTPHSYFSFRFKAMATLERLLFPLGASMPGEGLVAQYVCAPNEVYANWLKGVSRRPQTIIVTGSPLYDRVKVQAIPVQPPSYKVMFVHQPMVLRSKPYARFVQAFFDLPEYDPRIKPLFKVHPRTSKLEMDVIIQMVNRSQFADDIEVITSGDARTMMQDIGALVVGGSTVINDALLAGIPVVLLKKAFGKGFDAYADTYGAAIPVNLLEELYVAVAKTLFNSETRTDLNKALLNRAVPEYFGGLDGQAAQRIAALVIEKIAQTSITHK